MRSRRVERAVRYGVSRAEHDRAAEERGARSAGAFDREVFACVERFEWSGWKGVVMRREELGDGLVVALAGYAAAAASESSWKRRNCHANLDDYRDLFELL